MAGRKFIRFFFSPEDADRISLDDVKIEDQAHSLNPGADRPFPQSLKLTFKVNDPDRGAPQVRPLFHGQLTFIASQAAPGILPKPTDVAFTDSAYDSWKTLGTLLVDFVDKTRAKDLEGLSSVLDVVPNRVWYSPVCISKDFLFTSLRLEPPQGLVQRNIAIPAEKKPITPMDREKWAQHAVAGFLSGQYRPILNIHATDASKDDVALHPMPTVEMKDGIVELYITTARVQKPLDASDDTFSAVAIDLFSANVEDTEARHPRNGKLPARYVYRTIRGQNPQTSQMLDASGPFADKILAGSDQPRYFVLRFIRAWKPDEDKSGRLVHTCSPYLSNQKVHITDPAGNTLFETLLPAHGLVFLPQTPAQPPSPPPQIKVSLSGNMLWLDGDTSNNRLPWRKPAKTDPLSFDLAQQPQPLIIARRRMNREMLADANMPELKLFNACTYFSLRRTVRALIDLRITGGRLNFNLGGTPPEVRRLIKDAWDTQIGPNWEGPKPKLEDIVNNRPFAVPALDKSFVTKLKERLDAEPDPEKKAEILEEEVEKWIGAQTSKFIPILKVLFLEDAQQETIGVRPANAKTLSQGEMAYHLWQSRIDRFQAEETKRNFLNQHIGRGASGALVALGLAEYHFDLTRFEVSVDDYADRLAGKMLSGLEQGDLIQFWHFASDFDQISSRSVAKNAKGEFKISGYGHSPVFLRYFLTADTGFVVIDQRGWPGTGCDVVTNAGKRKIKWGPMTKPEEVWIASKWKE